MESTIKDVKEEKSDFSFKTYFKYCTKFWGWIFISVVAFTAIAIYYSFRKEPVYERHTDVLIKDEDMGGGTGIASAFSSLGLISGNTNVNNELISLTSPAVMFEVVKRLDLTNNLIQRKYPHNITLYGKNQPIRVSFPDLDSEQPAQFRMTLQPDGSAELYKFVTYENGKKRKFSEKITKPAGATSVRTPIGRINIEPYAGFMGKVEEPMDIYVFHQGLMSCVESYTQRLKGDLVDQDAQVIDLSIKGTNVQRSCDILNTIITVYNENWVEDKNRMAVATSSFIDERLKVIQQELGVVDNDISKYKSEHRTPDLEASAEMYLRQNSQVSEELLKANNDLAMTGYLYDYLHNPANAQSVIPITSGTGNNTLEQQISTFNQILLNRNNLVAASSETNPLVQQYDSQLKGLRESIMRAVSAQRSQLTATIRNLQGAKGNTQNDLANAPTQALQLLSIERQQKVKEELYLYLLQKREENELTQTFTAYNTRIITPPTGPVKPIAPKKMLIVVAAFIVGLALPLIALYVAMNSDTKIRNRKDLDNLNVPFAGEIPNVGKRKNWKKILLSRKKNYTANEQPLIVVNDNNRNVINEAFRVVRSNLNMMFGDQEGSEVIMFTSFNPGSGKSFISYNLASAFVLKRNKVLVIDADLRHGSASSFVGNPRSGLSNYLLNKTDDWQNLIIKGREFPAPDVLPIGIMPPNPAELLENGRLGRLIEEAREHYDIIILDCPPTDIVVDTQIIEKYTDRTIFVVRAGLFEKAALAEIEEMYDSKRFKKMSILLNGTEESESRYQTYGSYQHLEASRK